MFSAAVFFCSARADGDQQGFEKSHHCGWPAQLQISPLSQVSEASLIGHSAEHPERRDAPRAQVIERIERGDVTKIVADVAHRPSAERTRERDERAPFVSTAGAQLKNQPARFEPQALRRRKTEQGFAKQLKRGVRIRRFPDMDGDGRALVLDPRSSRCPNRPQQLRQRRPHVIDAL